MSDSTKRSYLLNLKSAADRLNGILDTTGKQLKHTEYERVILALASIGEDPASFAGNQNPGAPYNFVEHLLDTSSGSYKYQVSEQGNNGTIFALIALDAWSSLSSSNHIIGEDAARANWISTLIDWQQPDGSWPIYNSNQSGGNGGDFAEGSSIDVTAMALQALAPYYTGERAIPTGVQGSVSDTVRKALSYLSDVQNAGGGYGSSEASAQVIVALSALGMDAAADSAFVKNGRSVLSDLLGYFVDSTGGFRHTADGSTNQMATEQAAYALVAYDRYLRRNCSLYDMSDVMLAEPPADGYTITASVRGGHGSILPDCVENAKLNDVVTFTIVPDAGYEVDSITVDGTPASSGYSLRAYAPAASQACIHELSYEDPVPATCAERGTLGYWVCAQCGGVFLDEAAAIPVTSYEMLETEIDPFNHIDEEPLVLLSFLRRTLCLRFLSFCLLRDVHFLHDFQLQKTQFSQLFRPFAIPAQPNHFSLSGGILRSGNSQSNPRHFPEYLPFQRTSAPNHLPSLFLLVRLSGASLWSIAPIQCPIVSPCFFPFREAPYAVEFPNQIPCVSPAVYPFRGIL